MIPVPISYLVYALFGLSALMILGNLILKLIDKRSHQFAFNSVMLLALIATIIELTYSGYTGSFLNVFSINPFSLFFSLLFAIGLLLINFIAYNYSENYQDFAIITDFALMGMFIVASSTSLIGLFLGFELSSLPVIFAILLSRRSIEAAAKLFIMSAISIAVFSFAAVTVYGASGSFALAS